MKCHEHLNFLAFFDVLLQSRHRFSLFSLAEAYIIQVQKYDVSVSPTVTSTPNTAAKGTLPTTATATKMATSVSAKKPNAMVSTQSPKVNTLSVQSVQGSVLSPAKPGIQASTLPGTKSPITTLVQKTTAGLTPGKTLSVQNALQNAALSNVAQTIAGNKVIQVNTGAQLKTVLPGQVRGNAAALIRPTAPGVATAQRASLSQPVISLQRPVVQGQTAIKVNSVAGKTNPAVTASQGATPTQYALVRAQIPGTGGGPPQTVTFIRAISPGGQAASGGATVTVTPQQMAALLRGQTTALKGAAQSQIRNVSPSTQGGTTAGLSTIRPVAATANPQAVAGSPKVPVGKQIIQIAAAQLAANQSAQSTVSASTTSPNVPAVAKVNVAGLANSSGTAITQTPALPSGNAPSVQSSSSQYKQVATPTAPASSSDSKVASADTKAAESSKSTIDTAVTKNVDEPVSNRAIPASPVDSTTVVSTEASTSVTDSQVASTGNKEALETTDASNISTTVRSKSPASSDADSTTNNPTANVEKEKEAQEIKESDEKEAERTPSEVKEAVKPATVIPVKQEASLDLSRQAESGSYSVFLR